MIDGKWVKEKAFSMYVESLLSDPEKNRLEIIDVVEWLVLILHQCHAKDREQEFSVNFLVEKIGALLENTPHRENWEELEYYRPKTNYYPDLILCFERTLKQENPNRLSDSAPLKPESERKTDK